MLWGLGIALCATTALWWHNRLETPSVGAISLLYFIGAASAYPVAIVLAGFVAQGKRGETRFAAVFLSLALLTIGITAAIFAVGYRNFYAQWHDPFPSRAWVLQQIFTTVGAVYQFAVLGIRLYLPYGFAVLALTSLFLARRMR